MMDVSCGGRGEGLEMTAADNSVASGNTVEPTFQVGCFEVILTIVRFILFRFSLINQPEI